MNVGGTATLINNTFTRNRCTISSSSATGGGLLAYSGTTVSGKNNIVYDNVATTNANIGGTANFTYSDVGGGLAGTGNINQPPLFVNTPPTGYCFLSQTAAGQPQNSPCLNAGDPTSGMITGSTRSDFVQDAGVVDMGFHYSGPLSALDNLGLEKEFTLIETPTSALPGSVNLHAFNHPNPFNPATTITLVMDQTAPVELTVYNPTGQLVTTLFQGSLEAGSHDFFFSGAALPTGLYVYRATVAGQSITGKALLVK